MKIIENSSELKRIQLDILNNTICFCKKYSIQYYMCGGSLLGAIRHKGYIPWDDDIDIMMLRDDYERFIALYNTQPNPRYKLLTYYTNTNYFLPYAKISDQLTKLVEKVEYPSVLGVNIDIFPIDIIPSDKALQEKMYRRLKRLMSVYNLKQVSIKKGRPFFKNLALICAHLILKPIKISRIVSIIDKNAKQYHASESKYCGIAVWGYGLKEVNLIENYKGHLEVPFEDMMVSIPVGYDNYLSSVYGNYMQYPPENKRVTHHNFVAWWK